MSHRSPLLYRLTPLALLCLVSAPAAAQPSISAAVSPGVTSFGAGSEASGTVNGSGQFEHLFKEERVRVVYELDAGDFSTPGDWRFFAHAAGGSYRFTFDEAGRHSLYVGGDGYLRRNGDSWAAADFHGAGAFANLELQPGRATVRTGYRFDIRRFPSLAAMNQAQHSGFGSVLVSFETRTTLIGEISVGSKHYEAVSPGTIMTVVPSEAEPTGDAIAGAQGRGRAWHSLWNVSLIPVEVPGSPGSDAYQITLFARVAQSLAARTGLSVEVARRSVSGQVPPALVTTPAMYVDDGVYDDLFASDATRGGITLKSIVTKDIEVTGSIAWSDKRYGSTYAFDETGALMPDVLRHDRITAAQAFVAWPLFPSRTGKVALDLITGYDYARHASTSALYRYTAHTVRVGLGVTY
jgi:hypothetical protein